MGERIVQGGLLHAWRGAKEEVWSMGGTKAPLVLRFRGLASEKGCSDIP